jgi:CDGSH-type Zn-finger protein
VRSASNHEKGRETTVPSDREAWPDDRDARPADREVALEGREAGQEAREVGQEAREADPACGEGSPEDCEASLAGRAACPAGDRRRVVMTPGGPALIEGPVEIVLANGSTVVSERFMVALCLCRRSRRYPFCDTSHRRRAPASRDRRG